MTPATTARNPKATVAPLVHVLAAVAATVFVLNLQPVASSIRTIVSTGEAVNVADNTTIADLVAVDHGGAFKVKGGTLNVGARCKFDRIVGSVEGGAIQAESGSVITIGDSCEFTHIEANTGGAISALSSKVTIGHSCIFSSNTVTNNAGVLFAYSSSISIGDGCIFSDNASGGHGGVFVAMFSCTVTIGSGCAFTNNKDDGVASVMWLWSSTVTTGENCSFSDNKSVQGGAIRVDESSSATFGDSSLFFNNTGGQPGGGAISTDLSTVIVGDRCDFSENSVHGEHVAVADGPNGGAILVSRSTLTIGDSCNFKKNSASSFGGAISTAFSGVTRIGEGGNFSANSAGEGGGSINVGGGTQVYINPSADFVANAAPQGADGYVASGATMLLAEPANFGKIYQDFGGVAAKGCPAGKQGKLNFEDTGAVGGSISDSTTNWPSADNCDSEPDKAFTSCCGECAAGTVSIGSQVSCVDCPPGHFQTAKGEKECKLCNVGKYQDANGQTKCNSCEQGTYADTEGTLLCTPCSPGTVSSGEAAECSACPMGTSAVFGAGICSACADGYIASAEGTAHCEICAPGTRAVANRTACVECPRNTFSLGGVSVCTSCTSGLSERGSTSCTGCQPGQVPSSDGTFCEACSAGLNAEYGAASCTPCDDGYIASVEGTAYCEMCGPGTHADANRTACAECPRNTFSLGGVSVCTPCSSGELAEPGSSSCSACESGFAPSADNTTCAACPSGTWSAQGNAACTACEPGKAADQAAATSCASCPAGRTSEVGSAVCGACAPGLYSLSGWSECQSCPSGKWSKRDGSDCLDCETFVSGSVTDEESQSTNQSCSCPEGYYLDSDPHWSETDFKDDGKELKWPGGKCIHCVQGMRCVATGATLANVQLELGYWRTTKSSTNILSCPNVDACASTSSSSGGGGDAGANFADHLCAVGYTGVYCGVCDEGFAKDATGGCLPCESTAGIALVCAMCALLLALICAHHRRGATAARCCACPRLVGTADGLKKALMENRVKLKICFVAFQIISILPSQFSVRFPHNFLTFLDYAAVVNLDVLQTFSVDCWSQHYAFSFYHSLLVSALAPIVALLSLAALYATKRRRITAGNLDDGVASPSDRAKLVSDLQASYAEFALLLIYCVYPGTSVKLFQIFFCDKFDDGRSMLQADLSLPCSGATYGAMQAFAGIFILVYPVGIPLLFAWLLRRPAHSELSRFLWLDYGEHAHFFEVFECARRLLLTGTPLFYLDGKLSQVAVGLLLSLASMCVFIDFKPYRVRSDSIVGVVSQVVLSLTFLSALLFKCDAPAVDGFDETVFGGALIVINLGVVSAVAVSVGITTRQRIADELARAAIIVELERGKELAAIDKERADKMVARLVSHKRVAHRRVLQEEQKTLELVDMREDDQRQLEEVAEQRRTTAAHQLDLFEHTVGGTDCPFGTMTADNFSSWLRAKRESSTDKNARPNPQWWALAATRFEGMSGFDLIRHVGNLSDAERLRWIKQGTADAPLATKFSGARAKMVSMCLDSMQFGWFCKLWQSLEEGANPLMDWICAKRLGKGAFGEVFLVENRHNTGRQSAIKFVSCLGNTTLIKDAIRETELQMSVSSEFVVRVESWKVVRQRFLWVRMECCFGGELSDKLIGHTREDEVDEEQLWLWIVQLCKGIGGVHAAGVAHRDLKPDNVLLGDDDTVRIADFGLAGRISPGGTSTEYCGTPSYMAPEVRALSPGEEKGVSPRGYDVRADIFALGIVIHQMCCPNGAEARVLLPSTLPGFGRGAVTQRGIHAALAVLDGSGRDYSHRIKGVLRRSLVLNPDERASAAELTGLVESFDEEEGAAAAARNRGEQPVRVDVL